MPVVFYLLTTPSYVDNQLIPLWLTVELRFVTLIGDMRYSFVMNLTSFPAPVFSVHRDRYRF